MEPPKGLRTFLKVVLKAATVKSSELAQEREKSLFISQGVRKRKLDWKAEKLVLISFCL